MRIAVGVLLTATQITNAVGVTALGLPADALEDDRDERGDDGALPAFAALLGTNPEAGGTRAGATIIAFGLVFLLPKQTRSNR